MWGDGEIYDPDEGEDHHARMWILDDGTLRVRIYDLFPIFGGDSHLDPCPLRIFIPEIKFGILLSEQYSLKFRRIRWFACKK